MPRHLPQLKVGSNSSALRHLLFDIAATCAACNPTHSATNTTPSTFTQRYHARSCREICRSRASLPALRPYSRGRLQYDMPCHRTAATSPSHVRCFAAANDVAKTGRPSRHTSDFDYRPSSQTLDGLGLFLNSCQLASSMLPTLPGFSLSRRHSRARNLAPLGHMAETLRLSRKAGSRFLAVAAVWTGTSPGAVARVH